MAAVQPGTKSADRNAAPTSLLLDGDTPGTQPGPDELRPAGHLPPGHAKKLARPTGSWRGRHASHRSMLVARNPYIMSGEFDVHFDGNRSVRAVYRLDRGDHHCSGAGG